MESAHCYIEPLANPKRGTMVTLLSLLFGDVRIDACSMTRSKETTP